MSELKESDLNKFFTDLTVPYGKEWHFRGNFSFALDFDLLDRGPWALVILLLRLYYLYIGLLYYVSAVIFLIPCVQGGASRISVIETKIQISLKSV